MSLEISTDKNMDPFAKRWEECSKCGGRLGLQVVKGGSAAGKRAALRRYTPICRTFPPDFKAKVRPGYGGGNLGVKEAFEKGMQYAGLKRKALIMQPSPLGTRVLSTITSNRSGTL